MGHKPKLRFTVNANGREIELFSVRKRGDGSIILLLANPTNYEHPVEGNVEFVDEHISVHPSNNGRDTTITNKTFLANGDDISRVAYLHDTKDQLFAPLMAMRLPEYAATRPPFQPSARDTVISIGQYNSAIANLFFSVFVCNPPLDPTRFEHPDVTIIANDDYGVQLLVLVSFITVPTPPSGDVSFSATSPEVWNEEFREDHFQLQRGSYRPEELFDEHWALLEELRSLLIGRVIKAATPEMRLDLLLLLMSFFTKRPLEKLEQAVDQYNRQIV